MTCSKVFSLCLDFSFCDLGMLRSSLLGHRNLTWEVEKGIYKAILWEGQLASLEICKFQVKKRPCLPEQSALVFPLTCTHTYTHNSTLTWTNPPKEKLHLGEDSGLRGRAGFVKQGHGVRTGGTLWRKTEGFPQGPYRLRLVQATDVHAGDSFRREARDCQGPAWRNILFQWRTQKGRERERRKNKNCR